MEARLCSGQPAATNTTRGDSTGIIPGPDLRERGSRCYLNCGSDTKEAMKALQLLKYSAWKMP